MYNDFVIGGPSAAPAGISGGKDAAATLQKVADREALFNQYGVIPVNSEHCPLPGAS
jgi:ABC-type tungstate transport system permease subunit